MTTPTKQSSIFGNLDVALNTAKQATEAIKSFHADPTFRFRKEDVARAKRYFTELRKVSREAEPLLKDFNLIAK